MQYIAKTGHLYPNCGYWPRNGEADGEAPCRLADCCAAGHWAAGSNDDAPIDGPGDGTAAADGSTAARDGRLAERASHQKPV